MKAGVPEGARRVRGGQAAGGGAAGRQRQGPEVDQRQRRRQVGGRGYPLDRRAVDERQRGAQRLVTADDLAQGGGERAAVEAAAQADRGGHVVEDAAGLPPIEGPQPLLGEGERRRRGAAPARDRRRRLLGSAGEQPLDRRRLGGGGGQLEDRPQGQLDPQRLAEVRDQ